MKRKVFTAAMVFAIGSVGLAASVFHIDADAIGSFGCKTVLAQETDGTSDENGDFIDFSQMEGVWSGEGTAEGEDLTITEDGLFVCHTKEGENIQGYLEYMEKYENGTGRYDMYNRVGMWISGFYLDSDTSLHMGNVDGAVFNKIETSADTEENAENGESSETKNSIYVLISGKRYTGMKPLYNNSEWNGGYYYSDMTEDGLTVIVNCSAENDDTFSGTQEEYRKQFASLVSDAPIENYEEKESAEDTEKFTYPAYELSFTTGANEDTCQWKMLFFQTDTDTFAYAYKMNIDWAQEMEEEFKDAVDSLELTEIVDMEEPDAENSGTENGTAQNSGTVSDQDYDSSAEGKSLENFISYFDNWYQYGDLNATSIHLYGDGTWEIYNARNADGSGGYLFDSGTFVTFETDALELYSYDGSYVADVILDGNDELWLYPMISDYGSIYSDASFSREMVSVAYLLLV